MDNNTVQNDSRRIEIYELQKMLRLIAQVQRNLPILNPDGIYGVQTENVVRQFQEQNGLPITGTVNFDTWTKISEAYQDALFQTSPRLSIFPFPRGNYQTHMGEKSDIIYIIQIILSAISVVYDEFENVTLSGTYDASTSDAVSEFQKINNLPQTGLVDRITWDSLAENYNEFSDNPLYTS